MSTLTYGSLLRCFFVRLPVLQLQTKHRSTSAVILGRRSVRLVSRARCVCQVMFWSRCETCGCSGGARVVSARALGVSLGTYVRWRAHATRYVRARTCPHALHAHAHAFVRDLTTACFRSVNRHLLISTDWMLYIEHTGHMGQHFVWSTNKAVDCTVNKYLCLLLP